MLEYSFEQILAAQVDVKVEAKSNQQSEVSCYLQILKQIVAAKTAPLHYLYSINYQTLRHYGITTHVTITK